MGINDLPIEFDSSRSREDHILDHKRLHLAHRCALLSSDFNSLQDAINAALGGSPAEGVSNLRAACRPLIIVPGTYEIFDPLYVWSAIYLDISAYGAILKPANNLETVFDLNGTSHCSFRGITIQINDPYITERGFWLRWDKNTSLGVSSGNTFEDIKILGRYKTGVQIGDSSSNQIDVTNWRALTCFGVWSQGEEILSQRGILIGPSSGNNVCHHFYGINCTHNKLQIDIQGTQAGVYGACFNQSELDINVETFGYVNITALRSEHSTRLLTVPSTGYGMNISLSDIQWYSGDLAEDFICIKIESGGNYFFNNLQLVGRVDEIIPKIKTNTTYACRLNINGLTIGNAALTSNLTNSFDLSSSTNLMLNGYMQNNDMWLLNSYSISETILKRSDGNLVKLLINNDDSLSTEQV